MIAERAEGLIWHSPQSPPFRLTGFPWIGQDGIFRRLPIRPKYPIRERVDILANFTAGGQIRFQTDSPVLAITVKLSGSADMQHMPPTGQCGFDCYIGIPGKQKYVNTTLFDPKKPVYNVFLYEGLDRSMRCVTIHFPLYQGVEEVLLGISEQAVLQEAPSFENPGKIVFYGTSITQGGCASRPGMAYPNILSRKLNRECINLGFSGNGRGEQELARLICEIEGMELLVLDYVPNVTFEEYRDTLPAFLDIVRTEHPDIPILVVSGIRYAMDAYQSSIRSKREACRDFGRKTVTARRKSGDAAIAFLNGDTLLGRDHEECTVDGIHPTDLGFMRIAEAMAKPIRSWLKG